MRYLNRREQAEYCRERGLKITKSQLTKLAHTGGGPEYQLWGNQAVSTPEKLKRGLTGSSPHRADQPQTQKRRVSFCRHRRAGGLNARHSTQT